jgi:hypothetical protein
LWSEDGEIHERATVKKRFADAAVFSGTRWRSVEENVLYSERGKISLFLEYFIDTFSDIPTLFMENCRLCVSICFIAGQGFLYSFVNVSLERNMFRNLQELHCLKKVNFCYLIFKEF